MSAREGKSKQACAIVFSFACSNHPGMTRIRTGKAFAHFLSPALLAMAAAGLAPATAVAATEEAQPQPGNLYDQLYDTIISGTDTVRTIDNQIETIKHTLATQDPNIAFANELKPGLLDRFGEAIRPWMIAHSERILTQYRPRFTAIFREELSDEDVATMVEFYTSPLGRKIMQSVSANYTGANSLGDINDFTGDTVKVDAADIEKDIGTAAMRTAAQITKEDIAGDTSGFLTNAALIKKMERVSKKITALRVQMESAQPDPDIAEGMEDSINAVLDEILPEEENEAAE